MKIFVWRSNYLKNYGLGTVAILTNDVEEARRKALTHFETYDRERKFWVYVEPALAHLNADEIEEQSARRIVFVADISSEPQITETLFMEGSD